MSAPARKPASRRRVARRRANVATARDVAKLAGVSLATVSRALSGSTVVTEERRRRVVAASTRLGYTPHAAARALASQRTRTIGAVIPTLESLNFAIGVEALQRRLTEAGYTLLLGSSSYDPGEEVRQVRALVAHGVDGLLLVGATHPPALYEFLEAKGVPFVATWALDPTGRIPCVGFDNRRIGRALADYLLDLGHTEFGVIAQLTHSSDRAAGRVAGIREALAARGLELRQQRLIERPHTIIEGELALRTLMLSSEPPTAVICGTDVLAFGALVECQRLGIAVPTDVSVAGINDVEFAAHLNPPLTTMRIPAVEIGSRAADYLLGRLASRPVAPVTEVQVNLIVRGSTAPAPGARVRRRQELTS